MQTRYHLTLAQTQDILWCLRQMPWELYWYGTGQIERSGAGDEANDHFDMCFVRHLEISKMVFFYVSAIFVELCGIALVQWSVPLPGDEANGDIIDPNDIKQGGDYNREQYFHKKIVLSEKGEHITHTSS